MNPEVHKSERRIRTKTVRFYLFVSTGNVASSSGTRRADNARGQFETGRFLFWTEDNRMHAAVDDRYYSYYAYDHSGERRLKLTGDNKLLDVNADFMATYAILNEPTLYPSAYMVLTNKGYTKHYYAGTERVAARLGGGGLDALYHVISNDGELQTKADMLFGQSLEQVNSRVLNENNLDCIIIIITERRRKCTSTIPTTSAVPAGLLTASAFRFSTCSTCPTASRMSINAMRAQPTANDSVSPGKNATRKPGMAISARGTWTTS